MKIIAFAGSNSSKSINKKLVKYASSLFENDEVEILDLRNYQAPLFSVDVEKEIGKSQEAVGFLEKLKSADLLLISLAENNGNYSTAFKNIFDWSSRIEKDVFQNKPVFSMVTSPGGRGGKGVLDIAQSNLPRYGANIKSVFSLPLFNENFDVENGKISNAEFDAQLKEIVNNFAV